MNYFIAIFVVLFICILAINVKRFIDNEKSPVITEPAYLKNKKSSTSTDENGCMSTTLYLVFETNDNIIKCTVPNRIYRAVRENTHGMLTHQGTRFKSFEFNGIRIEK